MDLSPVTHATNIQMPNQMRIGSYIEPKSVHKLKSYHESELWKQRFMGGAHDLSGFLFE